MPVDSSGGILIVEDEPLISSYISHVLSAFSFAVAGCSSTASEAIAIAAENKPRLAVVDIQICGAMNGIEVARVLRDRFAIPSIFLSGVKDSETIRRARAVSPMEILRKPFLPSELLDAIELMLAPPVLAAAVADAAGAVVHEPIAPIATV